MTIDEANSWYETKLTVNQAVGFLGSQNDAAILAIEALREKAARENSEPLTLDELARAYLELCGEDNCAGDSTVGIPQCQFYKSPDWDDVNQIPIPGGCKLKSYRHKPE